MGYVTFAQFCNSLVQTVSFSLFFNLELRLVVISERPWQLYTLRTLRNIFGIIYQLSLQNIKKLNKCFLFLWQFRGQLSISIQLNMIPPDRRNL